MIYIHSSWLTLNSSNWPPRNTKWHRKWCGQNKAVVIAIDNMMMGMHPLQFLQQRWGPSPSKLNNQLGKDIFAAADDGDNRRDYGGDDAINNDQDQWWAQRMAKNDFGLILSPLVIIKASRGSPTPQPPKAFCEKDELIFDERFFQTVGLVLVWGSFAGWRVLYHEVFICVCGFRDNVLCSCCKDICSNVITYSK